MEDRFNSDTESSESEIEDLDAVYDKPGKKQESHVIEYQEEADVNVQQSPEGIVEDNEAGQQSEMDLETLGQIGMNMQKMPPAIENNFTNTKTLVKMPKLPAISAESRITLGTNITTHGQINELQTSSTYSFQCCSCEHSKKLGILLVFSVTVVVAVLLIKFLVLNKQ